MTRRGFIGALIAAATVRRVGISGPASVGTVGGGTLRELSVYGGRLQARYYNDAFNQALLEFERHRAADIAFLTGETWERP